MMSKGVKGLVRAKSTLGSLRFVHTKPPLYYNLKLPIVYSYSYYYYDVILYICTIVVAVETYVSSPKPTVLADI